MVLRRRGAAENTARTYLAGVVAFMRFLERRGWLREHVSVLIANYRQVAEKPIYRTPLTTNAAAQLIVAMQRAPVPRRQRQLVTFLRDLAVLTVLYSTGMRRAEVSSLNIADVQNDQAVLKSTDGRDRFVFFDEPSRAAIEEYLEVRREQAKPLFIRHDNHRSRRPGPEGEAWRLSPQSVWGIVRDRAREYGLEVRTHDFRHLKARVLFNGGASLSEVQGVLGHESIATTARLYAPFSKPDARGAWKRFSVPAEQIAQTGAAFLDRAQEPGAKRAFGRRRRRRRARRPATR